jgi:hypothetical protein
MCTQIVSRHERPKKFVVHARPEILRLYIDTRLVYASCGAQRAAPTFGQLCDALRCLAVRMRMPAIPAWWSLVPETRFVDYIDYLREEDDPTQVEDLPPHAPLAQLIAIAIEDLCEEEVAA